MQFAGSGSTGGRRRRRLVVNGDGSGVDTRPFDRDRAEIASQLVASAAAAPWVPVTETRIWIYAFFISVFLTLLTLALVRPIPLPAELNQQVEHFFKGSQPRALLLTRTLFLGLSTQLGLLIGWYRSRCTLDFSGRYRVWPWAVALCALATFCSATNLHLILGKFVGRQEWLTWRGETVAWVLPFCVLSLPITLLLDRDVRNNRSSLFTLRFSGLLWLAAAALELYQLELQSREWFGSVRQVLPVVASATLFLGLWLHARIVAYVCPDPPKLDERSAWSLFKAGCGRFVNWVRAWNTVTPAFPETEEFVKPRRRRKKTEDVETKLEVEESGVKRKRKPPSRRPTTRTRAKPKPPEPETEDQEQETASDDESDFANDATNVTLDDESSPSDDESENRNPEPEKAPPVRQSATFDHPPENGRFNQVHTIHSSSMPAPHIKPLRQEEAEDSDLVSSLDGESSDDSEEGPPYQRESGVPTDPMKGLSKRQRREIKKQQRDQGRAR